MNTNLQERLSIVRERIQKACEKALRSTLDVRLIAVTKNQPLEVLQELINLGVRDLGENRVQEIVEKTPHLKGDFQMHMIGHLQTNKVNHVLPHISWIHSIDRERLINRFEQVYKASNPLPALVEVNTSGEESKSGCAPDECLELCERVIQSPALEFKGLMTIGPLVGGEKGARESFQILRKLGESCKKFIDKVELSMGMSGDFEWAIEEGATMIRVGTLLVGERPK